MPSGIEFIQTIGTAANYSSVPTAKFTELKIHHQAVEAPNIFVELAMDPNDPV
jgi:hypothetical protein